MLRLLTLALALALVSAPALAQPGDEDAEQAEYIRLSAEMKTLASKNAWEGVERTFQRLEHTGVPLKYQDYFLAAQAARAAGNIAAARDRLLKANDIKENREVMDWLWELDSSYGKVSLQCDPGTLQLEPESMPFHPDRAAAVRFAEKQVADTGTFEGYLPEGNYTFGKFEVTVAPRVQTVRIDARGMEVGKKGKKGKEEPTTVAEAASAQNTKPEPTEEPAVVEEPMPEPVASMEPAPEPVAEPAPEPVAEPAPEPVAEPAPEPVAEPAPEPVAEPAPEPAVAMAEPAPQPFTPEPAPTKSEVKTPKPAPERGKSPYTLGGMIGVGNSYGGIVGGGLQLVFRPGKGIFGVSGGVGYDVPYHSVGLSAALRVYPQKNIYLGAGVAPLIWYAGEVAGTGVAHGPEVLAGADFKFGPILVDANIGAGVAPAVGKLRPAISGGVGIGTAFF